MQRALFVVASALLGFALHVLYLRPLFQTDLGYNGWLDEHQCLIGSLCENELLRTNHLGTLALVAATLMFAAAFAVARVELPMSDPPAVSTAEVTSRPADLHARIAFSIGTLLLGAVIVGTLRGDPPGRLLWAAAIAAFAAGAARRTRALPEAGAVGAPVVLFLGFVGLALGFGTAPVSLVRGAGFAAAGAAALCWASIRLEARGSSLARTDIAVMGVMTSTTVVLGMARARSARYAFIGDEWIFYETARDLLAGRDGIGTFGIGGPNDYFTGATFEAQAAVMGIAGADVYGWRLASLLPFALSIPLMYAFVKWLGGRSAAITAVVVLGATHSLFGFTMVAYNNTQALVTISASLAALALAERRRTPTAYLLFGVVVGSTFIVYALARLVLFPVGVLFLAIYRRDVRRGIRALGWTTLGFVATSAPILFNMDAWQRLLKATPVEAEAPAAADGVVRQVVENVIAGLLQFIGNVRNTHFVYGPHFDAVSAVLVVVGLGYALSRLGRDGRMTGWFVGSMGFWVAVNGIQQYDQISNTRSFVMPLVLCVYAGLAVAAMGRWWAGRPWPLIADPPTWARPLAAVGFALVVIALNQLHIDRITNERQQLTAEAVLVEQFEASAATDGSGMPVYILWPAEWTVRESIVLEAHDVSPDRGVFLRPDELYGFGDLCNTQDPAMVVVHAQHPDRDAIADHMTRCWPAPGRATLTDPYGDPRVDRFTNAHGTVELALAPDDRASTRTGVEILTTDDAVDVALDADGRMWVLSRHGSTRARLTAYGVTGEAETSFALDQWDPVDLAITDEGLLVVAGSREDAPLVWYNGAGQPVRRYDGGPTIGEVGGITAGPSGSVFVTDAARNLVLHLDRDFELVASYAARGTLDGPASVARATDEHLWVYSARSGEIVRISPTDDPVLRLPAQTMQPHDAPRLAAAADGSVIVAEPEGPQVHQLAADGRLVRAWGPFRRPVAAAAAPGGDLVVVDSVWPEVRVVHGRGVQPGDTTGTPARLQTTDSINLALVDPGAETLSVDRDPVELDGQRYIPIGTPGFSRPFGIAVITDPIAGDLVVVSDPAAQSLLFLDDAGAPIGALSIDALGGAGELSDVAVSTAGTIYLLDAGGARLHGLTLERRDGPDAATFGPPDPGDAAEGRAAVVGPQIRVADDLWATHEWSVQDPTFSNARGLAVDLSGSAVVAATTAGALITVEPDGTIADRTEVRDGQSQPTDVVVSSDGRVWVVDAGSLSLLSLLDGVEVAVDLPGFNSLEAPHLATIGTTVLITDPELAAVRTIEGGAGADAEYLVRRPADQPATKTIGVAVQSNGTIWTVDSGGAAVVRIGSAEIAGAE